MIKFAPFWSQMHSDVQICVTCWAIVPGEHENHVMTSLLYEKGKCFSAKDYINLGKRNGRANQQRFQALWISDHLKEIVCRQLENIFEGFDGKFEF